MTIDIAFGAPFTPVRRVWRALTLMILHGCLLSPSTAAATTELILQMDLSWSNDSNPQRLASGDLHDRLLATEARLAVIHPLDSPDTRLVFSANAGSNTYSDLRDLDNSPRGHKAALEWRASELVRGSVYQGRARRSYDVVDAERTRRDMSDQIEVGVGLTLQITPWIELPIEMKARRQAYETVANAAFNADERSASLGIRWVTGAGSSLGMGLQASNVSFDDRSALLASSLGARYRAESAYLEATWQYSPFTRLTAKLEPIQRNYAYLESKSYSEIGSELHIRHNYSPKTSFTADWSQRPSDMTDSSALYTMVNRIEWGAQWRASSDTQIVLAWSQERQLNQLAWGSNAANPELRRERAGLGLIFAASRDVRLYLDGYTDHTRRSDNSADFFQNTLRLGVEYTFENMPNLARKAGMGARR
jgi:hypothetical protein